jgi:hypothetical protein
MSLLNFTITIVGLTQARFINVAPGRDVPPTVPGQWPTVLDLRFDGVGPTDQLGATTVENTFPFQIPTQVVH